jgi:foldase protein PrsA
VIIPDPPTYDKCVAEVRHDIPSLAKTSTKQVRADCKQLYDQYASSVMQNLIQDYWLELEANRDHIKVTDAQVQKAFNTARKQQLPTSAQFNAFLKSTGETTQDVLFHFRINQIASKLLAKETKKVSAADIKQYYNSHKSQFGTQETRDIRIVLTKTPAQAAAAMKALKSGQSWAKVVRRYSTDPTTKSTGGLLVRQAKGQVDPALGNAAFAAPTNKLLGPVKGQFGYYVFEVVKITAATQQSLASATPLISQTLNGQQSTNAQNTLIKLLRKHWLGKTSCRSGYILTSACPGYKAPKTPTVPGG